MKRFYKEAAGTPAGTAFRVTLDGRPVRTPGRRDLDLPTLALAKASAAEWNGQGDKLDMATMPMTALAYAAVDRVAADPAHFAAETARFAETDMLCYRAPGPATLCALQAAAWDPILAWLKARHGAGLVLAEGVMPVDQPAEALAAVRAALDALDPFRLTAAHSAARAAGSVGVALALVAGEIDARAAADAASVDEAFQLEQWGEDADARALLTRRRVDLVEIGRFIGLLR
ncbi:MAG: ATP12 family protein [Alphaproteobacteria bacterium]